MRYLPLLSLLGLFCSTGVNAEMPIYAAYVSDELAHDCQQQAANECQLNSFDGDELTVLVESLPSSMLIEDALSLSEYEVLIGNALININEHSQQGELVLEITTIWRQVPIDDIVIRRTIALGDIEQAATAMLDEWAQHIQTNMVLEADKIYQVLGASNYGADLTVPKTIGDFVKLQSAVYRDPLLGSITRYSHPRFDSAVVDISVYPFSPFVELPSHNDDTNALDAYAQPILPANIRQSKLPLEREMENEIAQIRESIAQANIEDFTISSVYPATITVNGERLSGLRLEVLLHTKTDPQYSTQYIFQQNDKVIKLTGNLPEFMMSELVTESLPKIKVPGESSFMRALRQG